MLITVNKLRLLAAVVMVAFTGCQQRPHDSTDSKTSQSTMDSDRPSPIIGGQTGSIERAATFSLNRGTLVGRVADVGAGECVVFSCPGTDGNHYFIYDAGNFEDNGASALTQINDLVPIGSKVDLLVLSHSDADHLGAVTAIVDQYQVKRIIHSGFKRTTNTYNEAVDAINSEEDCDNLDLSKKTVSPGTSYSIGLATATFVAGFGKPPSNWPLINESERRNAGSVIIRLDFGGRSILLCGDAVGRHIDAPASECIAIERLIVDNAQNVPIDSDVVVAPHHGADNGSSTAFIKAVSPEYVIFSAGHKHKHPRGSTAERYLAAGVKKEKMLRTDRGDNEGGEEWSSGGTGVADPIGDDNVEISISSIGKLTVKYLAP